MNQRVLDTPWFSAVASIAITLSVIGCTGGGKSPTLPSKSSEAAQALSGKEQIKERLKMISETGSGGSAVSGMRAGLDQMKATEAELAADLLKDVEKLEKLQDPAKVKALAFQMLNKISK